MPYSFRFFCVLLAFILIGCSSPTPAVPPLPQPTNTPSPTHTQSSPPTPTPQDTPTPEQTELATSIPPEPIITPMNFDPNSTLVMDVRTVIAMKAAKLAADTMPGPYSWQEYRQCSTYVSAYLRQLSFPVDGMQGQFASYPDPFPWTNVVAQVNWLRRNFPQYTYDAPVQDFLEGKLWSQIRPGSVLYFQTVDSHNGLNDYYHTVVLVGYHSDGTPQFAEIAGGMTNVSLNRNFTDMTDFYRKNGTWNIIPVDLGGTLTPPYLKVTWFDPLTIINRGQLWQKPGPVIPNSPLLAPYDKVITINIYDGTLTVFDKSAGSWTPVSILGHDHFYAVLGRFLPANKTITHTFDTTHQDSIYDGDFGVYYSFKGIYQHTWTPQLFSRLTGFSYIAGFGGLDGGTDTSLLIPQVYSPDGKTIEDYWDYSSFTFHRVPDVKNQDMLLRVDLLSRANDLSSPFYGPISVPEVNLSSGCINLDADSWAILKNYLQGELDSGKQIAVIFSYPDFDQNLLPHTDIFKAPFTGAPFTSWCSQSPNCDPYDRRNYRQTYLDMEGVQ